MGAWVEAPSREFCGVSPQTGLGQKTLKEIFSIGSKVGGEGGAVIWYEVFSQQHNCQSRLSEMRDCYPMSPYSEGCYRTDNFTY